MEALVAGAVLGVGYLLSSNENKQLVKKIQRVIYLLSNNVKLYIGKNGGIYYKTKRSKIYI